MSKDKPGFIRRFFGLIGKLFTALRWFINGVFALILLVVLVNLFGQQTKPLPPKAALTLTPAGVLVEQRSYTDPLTQMLEQSAAVDAETPVRDLVEAIDGGARDPRITALVLHLDYLRGGGISKLEEVGAAITRFKQSGKPVVAVADSYSQDQYYLASYADEIHLNPMGGVMITGYGYYGTYLKSATEKLKIQINVFRAGQFKSAVEPFTRDDMSPESRENTRAWLTELWQAYTRQVEDARQLAPGALDDYVNGMHQRLAATGGDLGHLALETGLVDHLSTRPALGRRLAALAGEDDDGYLHIDHKTYLSHLRLPGLGRGGDGDAIGVIVAAGTILDGDQPEGTIGGDTLAKLLQTARKDKQLKALVLRVDSPGGSAFASEVIRNEIAETRKVMPVIISMGSLAASGGYWISAGADEIWAMPTTLTGSIGVFGIVPTFDQSLKSLGIHSDGVGSTRLADIHQLDRPLSDEARLILQLGVDNIYQRFLALVAEGRGTTPEAVADVAGGRIWTGRQALDRGLVDGLGTFADAVNAAGLRAGLTRWEVKYIERPLSFQEQLLKQLAGSAVEVRRGLSPGAGLPPFMAQGMENLARRILAVARLNDPQGIYLHCFGCDQP